MKKLLTLFFAFAAILPIYADDFATTLAKAKQGDVEAQMEVGDAYWCGYQGVKRNNKKAFEWYLKAAEHGNAIAQTCVGVLYSEGRGVKRNAATGVAWFRKAAEQGDMHALGNLGFCYYSGYGVEKDLFQAVAWFRKAAEAGHANVQAQLGHMYWYGIVVEKDCSQAMYWYHKAAEQDEGDGFWDLAFIYRDGYEDFAAHYTIEEEPGKAMWWFQKLIDKGAKAQKYYNYLAKEGYEPIEDTTKAEEFYQEETDKHLLSIIEASTTNDPEMQYQLGQYYLSLYQKEGLHLYLKKVLYWFHKAAEQEYAKAQYMIGVLFEEEMLWDKHWLGKSMWWYKKAAENGHKDAKEIYEDYLNDPFYKIVEDKSKAKDYDYTR